MPLLLHVDQVHSVLSALQQQLQQGQRTSSSGSALMQIRCMVECTLSWLGALQKQLQGQVRATADAVTRGELLEVGAGWVLARGGCWLEVGAGWVLAG